jgi:hypothetical protein
MVAFCLCINYAKAQDDITDEEQTYSLYVNKDWKNLIKTGNKLVAGGTNYYYLRMRIGIAYFELKKYRLAIAQFEQAYKLNSYDYLTLEYLYYSYLYGGRATEANALLTSIPMALVQKINPPKIKKIQSINLEAGIAPSNLDEQFSQTPIAGNANMYGEATVTKTMQYYAIGLNHELSRTTSVYHSYSNIAIDMEKLISTSYKDTNSKYKLIQHDYYISAMHQFKHFSISPTVHFINVKFNKFSATYNPTTFSYNYANKDTSFVNYATSITLSKHIGIWALTTALGYAQLNGLTQLQAGVGAMYYPFARTSFYGATQLTMLNENNINRIITAQKIGVQPIAKLNIEYGITLGNMQNYTDANGAIIYNTSDKVTLKHSTSVGYGINKHVSVAANFTGLMRQNTYYNLAQDKALNTLNINYATYFINGGLKWSF